jgi:hypothetical protein
LGEAMLFWDGHRTSLRPPKAEPRTSRPAPFAKSTFCSISSKTSPASPAKRFSREEASEKFTSS